MRYRNGWVCKMAQSRTDRWRPRTFPNVKGACYCFWAYYEYFQVSLLKLIYSTLHHIQTRLNTLSALQLFHEISSGMGRTLQRNRSCWEPWRLVHRLPKQKELRQGQQWPFCRVGKRAQKHLRGPTTWPSGTVHLKWHYVTFIKWETQNILLT